MGKIVEKVVATRLGFLAGKHSLIPETQFGGRPHSCTGDALLAFVHDVHAAWNNGMVVSELNFDIKGYFDNVDHNLLLARLRKKRIPVELVRWVASFLDGREVAVSVDGIHGEMEAVNSGIPQGSPSSPILAGFYSADLLDLFSREKTIDGQSNTCMLAYVDDGKIYVASKSLDTNINTLRTAYKKVEGWLKQSGLQSDLDKRELMHYVPPYSRNKEWQKSPCWKGVV